ncbi:MAG: phosphoribosylglycinamide formyltransferase [Candidatus Bathyarchaeia archaeon]|jgi:formyltetrahydrofolate-dependent phosphoribosylglycinamide formyltransferase
MRHLAVFASGRGSNFRAIADHARLGILQNIEVSLLVTNDSNAPVVQIAREDSIPNVIIEGVYRRKFASKHDKEKARNEFDERAVGILKEHQIDLVALAGFMQVLGPRIVEAYRFRIMNIHPAKDLVRFGGAGMFGKHVHAAVLDAGQTESGCTVHYVDESVDRGPIILQSAVSVEPGDTPEALAERILIQEHRTYPKAIQLHTDGRIAVRDGKAMIDLSGGWLERWNRRQEAFINYQAGLRNERLLESST